MHKKSYNRLVCLIVCCILMVASVFSVSAIDDTYTIDELGITLKIPKEYTVITRSMDKNDPAFSELALDYDATMNAFYLEHIYLQAESPDRTLKIDLTQTTDDSIKSINNYSDLTAAQRQDALDIFLLDDSYTSGVEIKHNDNIYFDFDRVIQGYSGVIYAYQCHTVINGMNINLTMQKNNEQLTADEIKVCTNIANSIDFDEIILKSGLSFDWWRFLLWIVILIAVAMIASYLYKKYNKSQKALPKERKLKHNISEKIAAQDAPDIEMPIAKKSVESKAQLMSELGFDEDGVTFDELLGYDKTDYYERANTEMDSFDVKVKAKNSNRGVAYFEDGGKHINKKERDYFDDFFSDNSESTTQVTKNLSSRVKMGFKRCGYFGTNLYRLVFPKKKSKHKHNKK